MMQCQFQLIIGETLANKYLTKTIPVSYGIFGLCLFLAFIPQTHRLLLVLGIVWVLGIISILVIELAKIELYQIQGIIKLSEAGIVLNGLSFQTIDLQQMDVRFNLPRGQGIGRNGVGKRGNKIIIHTSTSDEVVMATVLVETNAQRNGLVMVLKGWKKAGVSVSANGIDLV